MDQKFWLALCGITAVLAMIIMLVLFNQADVTGDVKRHLSWVQGFPLKKEPCKIFTYKSIPAEQIGINPRTGNVQCQVSNGMIYEVSQLKTR